MEEHYSAVEQNSLFEELGSPPSEEKNTRMESSKNSNFIHLFNSKQNRVM
jgi:hypothetical protein